MVYELFITEQVFPDATSLEITDEGGGVPVTVYVQDGMFMAPEGGWGCDGRRFQCIYPHSDQAQGPSTSDPSRSK